MRSDFRGSLCLTCRCRQVNSEQLQFYFLTSKNDHCDERTHLFCPGPSPSRSLAPGSWFHLEMTSPHNDNSCEWTQLAPGPGPHIHTLRLRPCSCSWTGHSPSSSVRPITSRQDRRGNPSPEHLRQHSHSRASHCSTNGPPKISLP